MRSTEGETIYNNQYIPEWYTDIYDDTLCNHRLWRKAQSHQERHIEDKDEDGKVVHKEDWTCDIIWEWVDGKLTNPSTGNFTVMFHYGDEAQTITGTVIQVNGQAQWSITSGEEHWPWWKMFSLGPNDFPSFTAPGMIENYDRDVWEFSDEITHEDLVDAALGRRPSTMGEWHGPETSHWGGDVYSISGNRDIYAAETRLKADGFGNWKESYGIGIIFSYRLIYEQWDDACHVRGEDVPALKPIREWIEEDYNTPLISLTANATEAFSKPIDGIPSVEEMAPATPFQKKIIMITGPSRKIWPILKYQTTSAIHDIPAFQAYDGSNAYFRTEKVTGGITSTQHAGGDWTEYNPLLVQHGSPNHIKGWHNQKLAPIPPSLPTEPTHRTVYTDAGLALDFSLSNPVPPNEAKDNALSNLDPQNIDYYFDPIRQYLLHSSPPYRSYVLASFSVGTSRLTASIMMGKYTITISRPSLTLDGSGTIVARWKIHTRTASGGTGSEDFSESYTWPARDDEDPEAPEPAEKTFGPYEVTAQEGETKWIEVLEPEEAQHVWPNPIWYVAPKETAET